jgi:hypothetical protein
MKTGNSADTEKFIKEFNVAATRIKIIRIMFVRVGGFYASAFKLPPP